MSDEKVYTLSELLGNKKEEQEQVYTLSELTRQLPKKEYTLKDLQPRQKVYTLKELQAHKDKLLRNAQKEVLYKFDIGKVREEMEADKPSKWNNEVWDEAVSMIAFSPGSRQIFSKQFWKETGKNLLNSAYELVMEESIIRKARWIKRTAKILGKYTYLKPMMSPFMSDEEKPIQEGVKELGRTGFDYVTYIPVTAFNLVKDPLKTIHDSPLDVVMLIGVIAGMKSARNVLRKMKAKKMGTTTGDWVDPIKNSKRVTKQYKMKLEEIPSEMPVEFAKQKMEVLKTKAGGTEPIYKPWQLSLMKNLERVKDLPDRPWTFGAKKGAKWGLRTAIRVFEYYPTLMRNLYHPMRYADFMSKAEARGIRDALKIWKKQGVNNKSMHRVGVLADYMQGEKGAKMMADMGLEMPKNITPLELKFYQWSQQVFKDILPRINKARKANGLKPLRGLKNYSTWIRNFEELRRQGIDVTKSKRDVIEAQLSEMPFQFAKKRKGMKPVTGIETHMGTLLEIYTNRAYDYIHKAPILARARAFLEPTTIEVKVKETYKAKVRDYKGKPKVEPKIDTTKKRTAIRDRTGKIWKSPKNFPDEHRAAFLQMKNAKTPEAKFLAKLKPRERAKYEGFVLGDTFFSVADVAKEGSFAKAYLKNAKGKGISAEALAEKISKEAAETAKKAKYVEKTRMRKRTISWDFYEKAPNLAAWMEGWIDRVVGIDKNLPTGKASKYYRAMRKVQGNIAMAILSYNVRSALIQPTALKLSYVYLGESNLAYGMTRNLTKRWRGFAMAESKHLATRLDWYQDVSAGLISEFTVGKRLGRSKRAVAQWGMKPLQYLDFETARATWIGAYRKMMIKYGVKDMSLKNLKKNNPKLHKRFVDYADDVVVKTQASAAGHDIAPIQGTHWGKLLTMFQTFVINEWDMLTHDVLGYKNPYMKAPQVVKNVGRFVLASAVVNALYEGVLKIRSPYPAPEWELKRLVEGNAPPQVMALAMLREFGEQLPIMGGTVRWSTPFRTASPAILQAAFLDPIQMLNRMASKPKLTNDMLEMAAKLLGVPGTSQAMKYFRRRKRGQSHLEAIMGVREEVQKRKKKKPTWGKSAYGTEGW